MKKAAGSLVAFLTMFIGSIVFEPSTAFGALDTLSAVSGAGKDNDWNAGGVSVGDDCAATGGTASMTTSKNKSLSFPLENNEIERGTISYVKVYAYAKANVNCAGTGDGIQIRVLSAWAQGLDGVTDELTTGYQYYSHDFSTDPNTGTRWTWSSVNALEAGCRSVASGGTAFSRIDVDHGFVVVGYNAVPILKGTSGGDSFVYSDCFQRADGSGTVEINYCVFDRDNATVTVSVQYWNSVAWSFITSTYLSGDKGSVNATDSTVNRQIIWSAASHLGAVEKNNYNIRVIAMDDSLAGDSIAFLSNIFELDTKAPENHGCRTPANGATPGPPNVTLESYPATDSNTVYYYFQYDDNAAFPSPDTSGWLSAYENNWVASGLSAGSTYYWRVKAKDSLGNDAGFPDTFSFTVSNVKPGIAINSLSFASDGSGLLTVGFTLTDPQAPENCKILVSHSIDNRVTWRQTYIASATKGTVDNTGVSAGTSSGQITGIATNASNESFVWDSKNAGNQNGSLNNTEYAAAYIRISPEDAAGHRGDTIVSTGFILDNKAPSGYACHAPGNGDTNISINTSLHATMATDISAKQYYFELDDDATFATPLQNSGWLNDTVWSPASLADNTTYYWHVKAKDAYTNEGAYQTTFSFKTFNALWVYPGTGTIGACSAPCLGDGVVYVGTGGTDDKMYCISTVNGSLKWSYQAAADVSSPCSYYYSAQGKYAVYFTTGDAKVYGIWDNGSSASNKFTPVDLGNRTISEPIVSVDGNYLYLTYYNYGQKRSVVDGGQIWTTGSISPNHSSAPMNDNDHVYFAASATTYKYTVDNTPQGSVAYGASKPLGAWSGVMYTTTGNNYAYAFNMSTMSGKWVSPDLGATVRTAVMNSGQGTVLVGSGVTVKALSVLDGTQSGSYTAGGNVQSMPIPNTSGTAVFFGCDNAKVYGINASHQNLSGWPKNVGGAVTQTPAVDMVNGVVIFCSNEGKVYGFALP